MSDGEPEYIGHVPPIGPDEGSVHRKCWESARLQSEHYLLATRDLAVAKAQLDIARVLVSEAFAARLGSTADFPEAWKDRARDFLEGKP